MSSRTVLNKTNAFCARMRKHVRGHDRAGIIVAFVGDTGETVTIETEVTNVTGFARLCTAIDLLDQAQDSLKTCTCGLDHAKEIAEIDAALFALRPAAEAPHGH